MVLDIEGTMVISYSPTRTCVRFELREMLGRITLLESEKKWGFEILQAFSLSSRIPPPLWHLLADPTARTIEDLFAACKTKALAQWFPTWYFSSQSGRQVLRLVEQFHRSLLENEVLAL